MVGIDAGGASDRGRVRTRNEDALHVGRWLFAVADGLGGHAAGDVASATALQPLVELEEAGPPSDPERALAEAVNDAHARVRAEAAADPSRTGMGTTLTVAAVIDGHLHLVHVGDSRCYLLRNGELEQRTVDHTPVQLAVDAGRLDPAQARHHPERHVLAQAVGLDGGIQVDARGGLQLAVDDRVLLCSDGLTEMVPDERIAALLGADLPARTLAERLCAEAVEAGGVDNVTTVVVRVLPPEGR